MAKQNQTANSPSALRQGSQAQLFSCIAPAAKSVQLVGDFTQWQQAPISMERQADGTWQTRVELSPGWHPYRFLVDGQWQDDPKCDLHVPNPFGSEDAVRQVA